MPQQRQSQIKRRTPTIATTAKKGKESAALSSSPVSTSPNRSNHETWSYLLKQLPQETILLMLELTQSIQTITEMRKVNRSLRDLIDEHPRVWRGIPFYADQILPTAMMRERGWTELDIVKRAWNLGKIHLQAGVSRIKVVEMSTLKMFKHVEEGEQQQQQQQRRVVGMFNTHKLDRSRSSYDLGDGAFAVHFEKGTLKSYLVDTEGNTVELGYLREHIPSSRYFIYGKSVERWDQGTSKLRIVTKDYGENMDINPYTCKAAKHGDMIVSYKEVEKGLAICALQISVQEQKWSYYFKRWPRMRFVDKVYMDDVKFVLTAHEMYEHTIIVFDVRTGKLLSERQFTQDAFATSPTWMSMYLSWLVCVKDEPIRYIGVSDEVRIPRTRPESPYVSPFDYNTLPYGKSDGFIAVRLVDDNHFQIACFNTSKCNVTIYKVRLNDYNDPKRQRCFVVYYDKNEKLRLGVVIAKTDGL